MKTIALSPAEVAAEPARQEPVKAGPGMKALLAEDIPVDRMLFQKMLIKLGHQVLVAEHGREGAHPPAHPECRFDSHGLPDAGRRLCCNTSYRTYGQRLGRRPAAVHGRWDE